MASCSSAAWAAFTLCSASRITERLTGGLPHGLTNAEFEILALLYSEGLDNHGVTRRRSVSVRTVETQLRRIYAKVGVRSRTEVITAARVNGWFNG